MTEAFPPSSTQNQQPHARDAVKEAELLLWNSSGERARRLNEIKEAAGALAVSEVRKTPAEKRADGYKQRYDALMDDLHGKQAGYVQAANEARVQQGLPPVEQEPAKLSDEVAGAVNAGKLPRVVLGENSEDGKQEVLLLHGHVPTPGELRDAGKITDDAPEFSFVGDEKGGRFQVLDTYGLPEGTADDADPSFRVEYMHFPQTEPGSWTDNTWAKSLAKLEAAIPNAALPPETPAAPEFRPRVVLG